MRIGVYFREVSPESGGGYTFESDLVDTVLQRAAGATHSFVFLGPPGPLLERIRSAGFQTVTVPIEGVPRWLLKAPRLWGSLPSARPPHVSSRLDARAAKADLDLLWCLGPDVPSMEVPYVMTVWDLQHRVQPFFPEVSSKGLWRARERYYATRIRRATFVVTGTEAGKAEIERFFQIPYERILRCGHPTPRFALNAGAADGNALPAHLDIEPGFIFYPAQFWPHKNHIVLLKALHLLNDEGHQFRLILVGSDRGGNLAYIRSRAKDLGIAESVRILGFVERDELISLYRAALLLAYVSYFGPENLPPLEAFALGCPVIAARVPGAEEQLGGAAELIDPTDHEALAAAIKRIANDESRRAELIARGHERARLITADDMFDRVMEAFERFAAVRDSWGPAGD